MDPHSHDHNLCGSASCSVLPCLSSMPADSGSEPASPCSSCSSSSSCSPSSSPPCSSSSYPSCSSPSSSSCEEESLGQLMRQWAPNLAMRATSWGMCGTKFANATADFSSTQLRSLAMLHAGTYSASSLVGLYTRMLPSKTRAHAAHKYVPASSVTLNCVTGIMGLRSTA